MSRWLIASLILVPVALLAHLVRAPDMVVFALSAASLVPIAGLIGEATEALAEHYGGSLGGLLNATFGNAAELIITLAAIREGLTVLVKASITGAILTNTLLALGVSFLLGGLRFGTLRFEPRVAGHNAALMILAVVGLYMPATFAITVRETDVLEELSLIVAGVLLLLYVVGLVYTLVERRREGHRGSAGGAADAPTPPVQHAPPVNLKRAYGLLALGTAGAAVSSELLVGTIETVSATFGWTELFVGAIVVPLVGTVAESFSAIKLALRNQPEGTLAITAGSSAQIALFVAPLLVLVSPLLGHPVDLIFTPLELAVLGLATAVFAYICLDGEGTWLEGAELLAVFAIAAVTFFLFPAHAP